MLAGADALRDVDVEPALLERDVALRVDDRHAERDAARAAAIRVLEVDEDLRMMVFARGLPGLARAALGLARLAPEQRLEEVARVEVLVGTERRLVAAAAELEAGIPVRRRLELLAGLVLAAHAVVGGALLGILQDLVGLVDFLEARLGVRQLADVGVVLRAAFL